MYSVYLIINKINLKKYVGYTKHSIERRFNEHVGETKTKTKRLFMKALRKYGKESFTIRHISTAPDHETAKWMEKRLVVMFESYGKSGYNMTPGGDGGGPHTDEHKQYMCELYKDREFTEDWKSKISLSKKGSIPWNKGLTKDIDPRVAAPKNIGRKRPDLSIRNKNRKGINKNVE